MEKKLVCSELIDKIIEISVIIPAYNEQENIARTVTDISDMLEKQKIEYQIIVVDDCSTDKTALYVTLLNNKKIKIIKLCKNYGKGFAIKRGIEQATGKYIAFIDADGQITPEHIVKFYEKLKSSLDLAVVGNKYHEDSEVYYSQSRWIFSRTYKFLVNILFVFSREIGDTQFGCKIFKSECLKRILPELIIKRFAYDIDILSRIALKYGYYNIKSLPVKLLPPRGKGSPSIKNIICMVIDTLRVWVRYIRGVGGNG